jgi:hypothetical protein
MINYPALTNRFRALIEAGELDTSILSNQLTTIKSFPIIIKEGEDEYVTMVFENDVNYQTSNVIKSLAKIPNFTIRIEALSGDGEVTNEYVLRNSNVEHAVHSQFDYAGANNSPSTARIKFKEYATLEGELTADDMAKMKLLFDSITLEIDSGKRPTVSACTNLEVTFSYTKVE